MCHYYSEDTLQYWDSVANPIGKYCYECDDCYCEHWHGDHSDGCPNNNPDCFGPYVLEFND